MDPSKVFNDIEKRRFVRLQVKMPAEVRITGENLPEGNVQVGQTVCRDLSRGGMCLEIPRRIEASWKYIEDRDNVFEINLSLTDQLKISSEGRVAWTQQISQKNSEAVCGIVGIEFIELDDKDRDAIIRHIVDRFLAGYPDRRGKGFWEGAK